MSIAPPDDAPCSCHASGPTPAPFNPLQASVCRFNVGVEPRHAGPAQGDSYVCMCSPAREEEMRPPPDAGGGRGVGEQRIEELLAGSQAQVRRW
jgi:hypothetical protein